mgnify:FL=1
MRVSLCLSSMIIFTDCFWNSVYWQSTVSSRLTLKEREKHSPLFILHDYFHWWLLKFGVCAESTVSSRLTLKERGKHARFPLFILHDYFHWSLLKFGVLAEYWTASSRLTLKERGKHACLFPSVSPLWLFSLIAFEIRCIGRVLLVLGSRFKSEVYSVFIFTACCLLRQKCKRSPSL